MRAVFGLDACHLFPQPVLAIISLIRGVQMHGPHTRSQEGGGSGWLQVVGPLAKAAGCTYFQEGGGSGWCRVTGPLEAARITCTPGEAGAVVGAGLLDTWCWWAVQAPGKVEVVTCTCSQDPPQRQQSALPLESEMAVTAHACPHSSCRRCPAT